MSCAQSLRNAFFRNTTFDGARSTRDSPMAKLMAAEEKEALENAIKAYSEIGVLDRASSSTKTLLACVPADINAPRLQTLFENHSQEIAAMARAKDVVYQNSSYSAI